MRPVVRNSIIISLLLILSFTCSFFFNSLVIHDDFHPETFFAKVVPKDNRINLIIPKFGGKEDCFVKVKFEDVNNGISSLKFNGSIVREVESKTRGIISTSICFLPRKLIKESGNELEIILRGVQPESVDIWVTNYRKNIQGDVYILKVSGQAGIFQEIVVLEESIFWLFLLVFLWNSIYFLFARTGFFKKETTNLFVLISLGLFLSILTLMHISSAFSGFLLKISFQYFTFLVLVALLPVLLALIYGYSFKAFMSLRLFICNYMDNSGNYLDPSVPGARTPLNIFKVNAKGFLNSLIKVIMFFFMFLVEILTLVFIILLFMIGIFLILRINEAAIFFADIAYFVILVAVMVKLLFLLFKSKKT